MPDAVDHHSSARGDLDRLEVSAIGGGTSLKTLAYNALKAAIMRMDVYAPTAELKLDERDLSARIGISRTPLREALAQLDREGLVKIQPRRGISIARKTKAEILDMVTAWAALESMAARLAATRATPEDVAALHELVDGFTHDAVARQMGEYSDANIAFHSAIIKASKCALIAELTEPLFFHVRAMRRRTIGDADRARRSLTDHRQIVAAIAAGEAETAERLVRDHTLKLGDHIEKFVNLD